MAATYSPRLKDRYKAEIVDNLRKQFRTHHQCKFLN
jgi:hypothetical protein